MIYNTMLIKVGLAVRNGAMFKTYEWWWFNEGKGCFGVDRRRRLQRWINFKAMISPLFEKNKLTRRL